MIKIEGVALRYNDTFYLQIPMNKRIRKAIIEQLKTMTKREYSFGELNRYIDEPYILGINAQIDISKDTKAYLAAYFSENFLELKYSGWTDVPFEFTEKENQQILDFINEWQEKIPENENYELDEWEYPYALSDDIPWKKNVLP